MNDLAAVRLTITDEAGAETTVCYVYEPELAALRAVAVAAQALLAWADDDETRGGHDWTCTAHSEGQTCCLDADHADAPTDALRTSLGLLEGTP